MRVSVVLALVVAALIACVVAHPFAAKEHSRKILLRNGHVNTLEHPSISENPLNVKRVRSFTPDTKHLYLVHVRGAASTEKKLEIEAALGQTLGDYIPHNTYVLYATEETAKACAELEQVSWVGVYEPEYKKDSELDFALLPEAGIVKLRVLLAAPLDNFSLNSLISRWTKVFATRQVVFSRINQMTIGAQTNSASDATGVTAYLINQPEVLMVAPDTTFDLHEIYVDSYVQSGANLTSLFTAGLNGTGSIVGIGDSGVEVANCYFFDSIHNVNYNSPNNTQHRKIAYYGSRGDLADGTGHGTAVAGAIAGEAYFPDSASLESNLTQWNGGAPGARLCVLDLNVGSQSLRIPSDLVADYFNVFKDCNAKTIVSAWGSSSGATTYTTQDHQVDSFVHRNPDFLPVFSVGNNGRRGARSISTPSSAKNCLAVGSSLNSIDAYENNLPINTYNSLAAEYNHTLCGPNGAASTLWNETRFCQSIANLDAPCLSAQDFFCDNFGVNAAPCCLYTYFKSECCAEHILESYSDPASKNYAPASVSSFSSTGPTYDGRIKPDIVAPGESITAARRQSFPECNADTDDDASFGQQTGTSAAAAVATAQAVLVREYFTRGFYPTGAAVAADAFEPRASLVKAVLINSATSLKYSSGLNSIFPTTSSNLAGAPDFKQGFGRLVTADSLLFTSSAFTGFFVETANLTTGQTFNKCVRGNGNVQITVVWTDAPAAVSAGMALVNNIDLVAIRGDTIDYANGGVTYDTLNNVEQIKYTGLSGVNINLNIHGTSIPVGPQEFSIVISGDFGDCTGSVFPCPNACNNNGACDTSVGACTCYDGYSGPDCSFVPCVSNCSGNGYCSESGECACAVGFSGSDCSINSAQYASGAPTVIKKGDGISKGAFIGTVIAAFIFGALLALFIGVFLGTKYAEHRRKKAKSKANEMLSIEKRG